MPISQTMGWSTSSPSASAATNAGYRPYEVDSRGALARIGALTVVLAITGLALDVSPARVALACVVGVAVYGPVQAWNELRRLREGLSAARTGPLPIVARPPEEPARAWYRSPGDIGWRTLAIVLLAVFVAEVVTSFDHWLPILVGFFAGATGSEAIVLVWLRRRRARDRMQIYVRDVDGDEESADPPRLHLVPRGA